MTIITDKDYKVFTFSGGEQHVELLIPDSELSNTVPPKDSDLELVFRNGSLFRDQTLADIRARVESSLIQETTQTTKAAV